METYRDQLIATRRSLSKYEDSLSRLPKRIRNTQGRVKDVFIYPIKALGGVRVEEAVVTSSGLEDAITGYRDRMAMLALRKPGKKKGQPFEFRRFSQRDEPHLSQFSISVAGQSMYLRHGTNELSAIPRSHFEARGDEPVQVLMNPEGEIIEAAMASDVVVKWIREHLRKTVTDPSYDIESLEMLVPTSDFSRDVEAHNTGPEEAEILFSDGAQILVTSAETLAWVNALLKEEYGQKYRKIFMEAFRPNIVLEGIPANMEDLIELLGIGFGSEAVELLMTALCVRCPVTQVERISASRPDKEPLKVLKQRPARPGAKKKQVTFGVNAVTSPEMWGKGIKRGSNVRVLSEKPAPQASSRS